MRITTRTRAGRTGWPPWRLSSAFVACALIAACSGQPGEQAPSPQVSSKSFKSTLPFTVSPEESSQFSSEQVDFQFINPTAKFWWVRIGNAGNYYYNANATPGGATTTMILNDINIPQTGQTVPVEVWLSDTGADGSWGDSYAFSYLAADPGTPGFTPATGDLDGQTHTFQWSNKGQDFNSWWLYIGTTVGGFDIYNSGGWISATSFAPSNLPVDGRDVYARIFYKTSEGAEYVDGNYSDGVFTAFEGPAMTNPGAGSTFSSVNQTFTWTASGNNVSNYWLSVGTTANATAYYDTSTDPAEYPAEGMPGAQTSVDVTGLPSNGSQVVVTLWFRLASGGLTTWQKNTYTYTSSGVGSLPAITAPADGSSASATTMDLQFTAGSATVQNWWIYVGTGATFSQYYDSKIIGGGATQHTIPYLPQQGGSFTVTLYAMIDDVWNIYDVNTYTAIDNTANRPVANPPSSLLGFSPTNIKFSGGIVGSDTVSDSLQVYAGSIRGSDNYFNSFNSVGNLTKAAISSTGVNITYPANGNTIYVRLWYQDAGVWKFFDYLYGAPTAASPVIASPTPETTLASNDSVSLTWSGNGNTDIQAWWIYVGTEAEDNTYGDSGNFELPGSVTTKTIALTNVPTSSDVYVTLYWKIAGEWSFAAFHYTSSATAAAKPLLTVDGNPYTGSNVLTGSNATLSWNANGLTISEYWMHIADGNTAQGGGVGGKNIYDSGTLGTNTSVDLTGLPQNGQTLYIRLWYLISGAWLSADFTVTSASATPLISSPTPGTPTTPGTLTGTSMQFTWSANGATVNGWWVYAGTDADPDKYYSSGNIGTTTSIVVTSLPSDGSLVRVELFYTSNNGATWSSVIGYYTAVSGGSLPGITSPVPDTTFTGSSATFEWTNGGGLYHQFWLEVGIAESGAASRNIEDTGVLTDVLSWDVTGLPLDGDVIYVHLWYRVDASGTWQNKLYTYTAKTANPAITSPTPGTAINGTSADFTFTADGLNVQDWDIDVGTTNNPTQYFNINSGGVTSFQSTATTQNITGLPANGTQIKVKLWYKVGGAWYSAPVYTYTSSP